MDRLHADIRELSEFFEEEREFAFSLEGFCEKCKKYVGIFEEMAGIQISLKCDVEEEAIFYGYEKYYIRPILLMVPYVIYNLNEVKVELPTLLLRISLVGDTINITIQDNSNAEEKLSSCFRLPAAYTA